MEGEAREGRLVQRTKSWFLAGREATGPLCVAAGSGSRFQELRPGPHLRQGKGVVLILHLSRRQPQPCGAGLRFVLDIILLSPGRPRCEARGFPASTQHLWLPLPGLLVGAESLMIPDGLLDKSQSAAFLELAGFPSQDSSAGGRRAPSGLASLGF